MPEQSEYFYHGGVTDTMRMLPGIIARPDFYSPPAIKEAEEIQRILNIAKEVSSVARDPQRIGELRGKADKLYETVEKRSQEIFQLLAPIGFLTSDAAGTRQLIAELPPIRPGYPDLRIYAVLRQVEEKAAKDLPFLVVYNIDYSKRIEEQLRAKPREYKATIYYAPKEVDLDYVEDGVLTRLGISFSLSSLNTQNIKSLWLAKGEGAWQEQERDGQWVITHMKGEKTHCNIFFGGPLFDEPRFITRYTPQYLQGVEPLPKITPLGRGWETEWLAKVREFAEMWAMGYAVASVCTENDFTTVPREIVQRHKERGTLVFPNNTVDDKTPGRTIVTFSDPLDDYPPVEMKGNIPLYVEG